MATLKDPATSALHSFSFPEEWKGAQSDCALNPCIHRLFENQVERTPDAVAVVFEEQQLTYAQLNLRANRLAHLLLKQGVQPDSLVGLCVERSLEMVIGVLGILKAGGAYVPLDPSYPSDRLAFMVEDAQLNLILTLPTSQSSVPPSDAQLIHLDDPALAAESAENPNIALDSCRLAYVIYTSGSTGRPKGALISHANVTRLMASTWGWFQFGPQDVWTLFHSLSFDFSVWELWGPLLYGGALIVVPFWVSRSPEAFYRLLQREGVTVLNQTPSAFRQLLHQIPSEDSALSLRWVIFGGEALEPASLKRWYELYGADDRRLINMYGITETTVHVTYRPMSAEDVTSGRGSLIGVPIPDLDLYVLNAELEQVPTGVEGELYVGGPGLARGYLNRPELTAERFIPNPFGVSGKERLYKTGDLARYLADGELEYRGRADQQVKIRGFRIELGEIETVLLQHPLIRAAVVIAHDDDSGDRRLAAYLVGDPAIRSIPALRKHLLAKLPDYMVPSTFQFLEALPLTINGKIDKKALPAPDRSNITAAETSIEPRSPMEAKLAEIWQEVLGVPGIGIEANFFELGGHSLLATRAISRIRSAFQIDLPVRALFAAPTPEAMAALLSQEQKDDKDQTHLSPVADFDLAPQAAGSLDEPCELSFAQQRLWFLDRLIPDSAQYLLPNLMRLNGVLNLDALQQALDEIVDRHQILRTAFAFADGAPSQIVLPRAPIAIEHLDLSTLAPAERSTAAEIQLLKAARRPIRLTDDRMLRVSLVKMEAEEHLLLLTMHHIASDGWSQAIFFRELGELYTAFCRGLPSPLPALPLQYADFAVWQRRWLSGERLERQAAYWKSHLAGAPPVLALPTDRPRPEQPTYAGAQVERNLPPALLAQVQALSQSQGATLFMTLLAVFQILLSRYSGQEDVLVGSPIANRTREQLEDLIGFFVNTLVMRGDLSGDPTFVEFLAQVRETALEAYAHQDLPFEKLVEELQPGRSLQYSPLFQVMFVLQNNSAAMLEMADIETTSLPLDTGAAQFDLTLSVVESPSGLNLCAQYATDLFDRSTIERMLTHFQVLLEGALNAPEERVSRLPMLSTAERHQMLIEWNSTQVEYRRDRCIHQLFEEQVARTPDSIAVVSGKNRLTYAQLNARANQLAHYLQAQGIRPGVLVGVCMERSFDLMVGILGILKAGGAYVPLDPSYPAERMTQMLQDAQAPLLLTQHSLQTKLVSHAGQSLCLDSDWDRMRFMPTSDPKADVGPNDLIYVIYTSGSTGKPKGTAVFHRGFANLMNWFVTEFDFSSTDRSLLMTSISFDLTQKNLYAALIVGGQLHLAPVGPYDPESLAAAIMDSGATQLNCTPSHFYPLISGGSEAYRRLATLRYVYLGGEPIDLAQIAPWMSHPLCHARVVNTYGPTECSDIAAFYVLPPMSQDGSGVEAQTNRPLPIGRPISNATLYILGAELAPAPVGVLGELYIGGEGVGNGYVNHPELTAAKFLPNPFSAVPGARMYRTGDMCRYLPDGNIEFVGRIDHQVKIRGFRIELGEIESVLEQHSDIREALVIAREDTPGDKQLAAYLLGSATPLSASALRNYLRERLPEYMVPAAFVFLEEFPLSPNGKIDRKALPIPDSSARDAAASFVKPRSQAEEKLAAIWQKVLKLNSISVEDSFFDLGGHSLLAIRLLSEIKRTFGINLSLADMFKTPTVRQMARLVQRKGAGEDSWSPVVPLQPHGKRPPLFCAPVGGGSAFYYSTLARLLGPEQPVYVFEPIGMNGVDRPHETVEEMAAYYLQHLRTVQPYGPYRLCGLSFGGTVAYEMAQQLQAAGEQVGCLILFDSHAPAHAARGDEPGTPGLRNSLQNIHYKLSSYMENVAAWPTLGGRIRYVSTRLHTILTRLRTWRLGKAWKQPYVNPVNQELPQIFQSILDAEHRSRMAYRPKRYGGRTFLLRAHLQLLGAQAAPLLGWDGLATNIDVIPVRGTHYSVLEEPCVHVTLQHVQQILQGVEEHPCVQTKCPDIDTKHGLLPVQ